MFEFLRMSANLGTIAAGIIFMVEGEILAGFLLTLAGIRLLAAQIMYGYDL